MCKQCLTMFEHRTIESRQLKCKIESDGNTGKRSCNTMFEENV